MTYNNIHNITAGQIYVNRKTGEEVTVTKYTKTDATRGEVKVQGRAFAIGNLAFLNEYRLK
jgi:hypothetical protein